MLFRLFVKWVANWVGLMVLMGSSMAVWRLLLGLAMLPTICLLVFLIVRRGGVERPICVYTL